LLESGYLISSRPRGNRSNSFSVSFQLKQIRNEAPRKRPRLDPKRSSYAVRGLSLSCGTSKNGARVAFTARWASTPSCSKPFPQNGQFSNSPRLACLANHSPQCQHFTTAVTHMPSTSPPSGRVLVRAFFRVGI